MSHRISIPKPCHEDWNAMTPNEQGRFCGLCAKTVTDFTGMSASEIQSYLLENSGTKVCGRFKSTQLDTITITIPERVLYSQTKFRNIFLLALLLTMGTTLFSCKDKNQTIGEIQIVKQDNTATVIDSVKPACNDKHVLGNAVRDSTNSVEVKMPEFHLTGAVAVDPVPPRLDRHTLVGEVTPIVEKDSVPVKNKEVHLTGLTRIDTIP
ncbi:hypothetical protein OGH69_03955 [Flavobacterium sp. MFBS3-15]|uniref:hypothetical protein n=1 Tax=Flavobacterium sp. MFBS3-15 TaxID=2989816 RepID=UPI0022367C58|nr:hypothetical protein [Flavobacterium sp. MFBS3-15]MCW4468109.1 hypothetical protein [Flavobacterium sp. MFBS3-15]